MDDDNKVVGAVAVGPHQARRALWVKGGLLAVHLASAAVQFSLAAAMTTFTFDATLVGLARIDVPDASGTPGLVIVDHGAIDAAYVFAAANAFAVLGYLFALFFNRREVEFVERGVMPFLWLSLLFSNAPLLLGVELVAGLALWTELVGLAALVAAVLFIYWIGTFINSHAHIDASRRDFSWAFLLMALPAQAVVQLVTFNAAIVKASNGGPLIHLMVPIVSFFGVFAVPLLLLLIYLQVVTHVYDGLLWLYGVASAHVLVVSWLAYVTFAADGITYP